MRTRIYHVNQDTFEQTYAGECDLAEALERDDPEYDEALETLRERRMYWCGGGAAQLTLLVRVD